METFLIGLLNIFIRIVESPSCFVLTCVIGSGLGFYYYRYPDNDIVLCILISLGVLFLFSVFFFVKIIYEKRRNGKLQKKREDELVSEYNRKREGKVLDVYKQMSEMDKNILFYSVLSGMKSEEFNGKFLYKTDKYTMLLHRIEEICSIDYFNSFAQYEMTGCNSFSVVFDPYLLDIAKNDIKEYGITKANLERFFDNNVNYG